MIAFLRRNHRKIQEIGTGLFLYEAFNYTYDLVFYPFALAYWGLMTGGVIVVGFSVIINMLVFWFYEYMRVDWLGAHALRELEHEENKSNIAKLVTWLGKKKVRWWEKLASPVVFTALLLPIDPVIVAIHFQQQHFKGLTWRDWGMLLLATLIANAWWLLKIGIIVEAVLYVWHVVF